MIIAVYDFMFLGDGENCSGPCAVKGGVLRIGAYVLHAYITSTNSAVPEDWKYSVEGIFQIRLNPGHRIWQRRKS